MQITKLPSFRFFFSFPVGYPSTANAEIELNVEWLTAAHHNRIEKHLHEIWEENRCEIIFIFTEFLKNEMMSFLKIEDIGFPELREYDNQDYFVWIDFKIYRNGVRQLFNTTEIECNICLGQFEGRLFRMLNVCGHIYCNTCMEEFCLLHIKEGSIFDMKCPGILFVKDQGINNCVWNEKKLVPNLYIQMISKEL